MLRRPRAEARGIGARFGAVDGIVYSWYSALVTTTTIRVNTSTRDALNELASQRGETVSDTVARGARLLRQELIAAELTASLSAEESAWLDADAG